MPPGWVDDGEHYPEKWTAADIRAWKLEQASVAATETLIRDVVKGGPLAAKQQELYFKLIGSNELRPGSTTVNIGKQTHNHIAQVNVRVITGDDIRTPQQLRQAQTMPRLGAGQGEVIEGEAVEVGAAGEGEREGEREGGAGEERG